MAHISRYHRVYKLPTGETLIYFKHNINNTTEYFAGFYGGSALDEIPGQTHYLEHILHQETPTTSHEEKAKFLAEHNIYTNAFTSYDFISFYTNTPNSFLDEAMAMDSEFLFNKTFSDEVIDNERYAIAEEINGSQQGAMKFAEYLNKMRYGITIDTLGTHEDIAKINKDVLVKYIDENFVSQNMFMVVRSNLEFEEIKEKFEKYFAHKAKSDITKKVLQKKYNYDPSNNFFQIQINNSQKTVEIDIAYKNTRSSRECDLYSYVEDYVFNNSFHGRLLKKLRTENGLVYSAGWYPLQIQGGMHYSIFTITTSKDKVNRALEVFGEIMTDLAKNGITQEELDNLKNKIIIAEQDRATGQKDTDLERLLYRYLNCDELFYNNQLHKVKDLTIEDVNRHFKKVYNKKDIFMMIAGDIDYDNMYTEDQILKLFNAYRTRYLYMVDQHAVLDLKTNKAFSKKDFDKALEGFSKEDIAKMLTYSYVINQNKKYAKYDLTQISEMTMEEKLMILEETANRLGLTLGLTLGGQKEEKEDTQEEELKEEPAKEPEEEQPKDEIEK